MTLGASPQDLSTNPPPPQPTPPADPFVGLSINGRFTISRLIGQGGMGSVYEARQEGLGRKVAIKLLKSDVADEHTRERFEREAKILSAFQHTNLVTIFDFGTATLLGEPQFYIAMEFIQGQDLDARLRSGPPLDPDALMHLILGVAQGLSEAHRNNIIHRDLKPANILLAPLHTNRFGFIPKILDFGIGRLGKVQSHLTQTGMVFGTPAYMAPEQATGSAEVGPHTDIYTFGVILYELLSGARPFVTNAPLQLIFAHANKPPPPLVLKPEYEGKIPTGLLRLVEWSLNKDPFDRPISKPPADCTSDEERQRCLVLLLEQAIAASNPSLLGIAASQSFNTEAISAVRFGASPSGVTPIASASSPAWSTPSPSTSPSSPPSFSTPPPAASFTSPAAYDPSPLTTPATPSKNPFYAAPPAASPSSDALPKAPISLAKAPLVVATVAAAPAATSPALNMATSSSSSADDADAKHVTSLRALSPPSPTRTSQPANRKPLFIAAAVLLAVLLLIWLLSSPSSNNAPSGDAPSDDTSQATSSPSAAPAPIKTLADTPPPTNPTSAAPTAPSPTKSPTNPTPQDVAVINPPSPALTPTPSPEPTPTPAANPAPQDVAAIDPEPTPTPAADPTPAPAPPPQDPTLEVTPSAITVTIPLPISDADAEFNRLIGIPSSSGKPNPPRYNPPHQDNKGHKDHKDHKDKDHKDKGDKGKGKGHGKKGR